ncbi:MAG: spsK [Acidobacteriales bacterium]|nr:spsK [Terriglobales bacterium]
MKILLIGANGQLGTDLHSQLQKAGHAVTPATRADLDVANPAQIESCINSAKPELVINTSAFHNVEVCETEPEQAFAINAIAVRNLALACLRHNSELMHFSTDFVFDGAQRAPYKETDLPHPVNVYGCSKLAGENLLAMSMERQYTIRTCGLFGSAGSRSRYGNFVERILKRAAAGEPLRVVTDQVLTPTYTNDLAQAVIALIRTRQYGLYQITNEGECSWFEFASKALELRSISADIQPVTSDAFAAKVKRPNYSVLSKERLYSLGIAAMPHWQDALARYLALKT